MTPTTKTSKKANKKTRTKTPPDTGPKTEDIKLDDIKVEGDIQQRVTTDRATIDAYAEAIKGGAKFLPLIVYRVGDELILADGFHRRTAYGNAGVKTALCEVREGTREDAMLYAATDANRTNGLRMTNADKRKAIKTVLALKGDEWSDRDIAKAVGCCHVTVGTVKKEVAGGEITNAGNGNVATPTAQQVNAAIETCRRHSSDPEKLKKAASELGKLAYTAIKAAKAVAPPPATFASAIPDAALNAAPVVKYAGHHEPVAV